MGRLFAAEFISVLSVATVMKIRTFDRRLNETEAVKRTRNLSAVRYLRYLLAETFGRGGGTPDPTVHLVYYPDYILYSSVVYRRLRASESLHFLAGVDAISGNVGEVDVELPNSHVQDVDQSVVIEPQLTESEAEEKWNGWIFEYMSRKYRAMELQEYGLDDIELVYTPYWILDNGSIEESLAVSDLTRRTAKVEEIQVIEEFYENRLSSGDRDSPSRRPAANM
jgi:hypothetical protein